MNLPLPLAGEILTKDLAPIGRVASRKCQEIKKPLFASRLVKAIDKQVVVAVSDR
jgi:hypothetical protein